MIRFSSKSLPELDKYSKPIALFFADQFARDKINSYLLIRILQWPVADQSEIEVSTIVRKDRGISVGYDLPQNASSFDDRGKYELALDIICEGLMALAKKEGKLTTEWIINAKQQILQTDFNLWVEYGHFINKKDKSLSATLVIHPITEIYEIYLLIKKNDVQEKMMLIFKCYASVIVVNELFNIGKWRTPDVFVLTGKSSEIEVQYTVSSQSLAFVNISQSAPRSPFFDMFKLKPDDAEAWTEADRRKMADDYLNAAIPGLADIVKNATKGIGANQPENDTLL